MRDRLLAAVLLCGLAAACGANEEPAEAPAETHAAEPADASPTLEQVAAEARAAAEAPTTAPAAEPAPDGESAPAHAADPSGHAEPAPAADAPPAH